ncbi:ATP-dependent RNA helicase DEAH12, chloroplastic [Fulvia fulva]|nr:ATP-dependent RNA helicase DEAH12, chloroplastic [Fulvia fulva]KAK4609645.1 ATP-dependent RNA helicase DEAH12, chloroplastic [Fulvia fulva]WPV37481.1 ATP-dependent RNA helicase DEAH12, chloroplastic [Fulvia fulva]
MDHCRFGARCNNKNCKYRHDGIGAARSGAAQRSEKVCVFFQQGKCVKGAECTYRHERVSRAEGLAAESPVLDLRSLITCKFHIEGKCLKGRECPYAHPENTAADGPEADDTADSFQRIYSGAHVCFTAGGAVSSIALTHEFSTVRLTGLPLSTTKSSAHEFVNALGCAIPETVTIEVLPTAASAVVYVTAQDSTFARTFCAYLKANPFNRADLSGVNAAKVRTRLPGWTATGYSRRDKVAVTWQNPTRSAELRYRPSDDITALVVHALFKTGTLKLCGQKVYAGGTPTLQGRWTTLVLQNVPFNITEADIENSIPTAFHPEEVEIPDVDDDGPEAASALIESLLSKIGPLEFTEVTGPHRKYSKAIARYFDESDAKDAVARLQATTCDFLNGGQLKLELLTSYTFRVAKLIYDSVEDQLANLVADCEDNKVMYKVSFDPRRRFATIRLESVSSSNVVAATKTVKAITDGILMEDDDGPIWKPSLRHESHTSAAVQRLADIWGVRILCHQAKRNIRYYGPPEHFRYIKQAVYGLLRAGTATSRSLPLDDSQFKWTCQQGLAQIRTRLGADNVSLDIISRPKKLKVTGSETTFQWAAGLLAMHKGDSSFPDCTICFTPADDPLTLSCAHVYCHECFEGLCTSTDATTADFKIICRGQDDQCMRAVPLKEVQAHLAPGILEEVLESSFVSHIRRRPQHYRYCPTPNCGHIFKLRQDQLAEHRHCSQCFGVICTSCFEQHDESLSCEEHRDLSTGGYEAFERFKRATDVKDCPRCKTPLEKIGGCNHITCGGCRAHICWVCLATFDTREPCYVHMNDAHGGIGLPAEANGDDDDED